MAPIPRSAALLMALFTASLVLAQTPSALNVTVRDASGAPVHGLASDRFTLTLDGHPQPLLRAVEHTADAPPPPPFELPPGTFSDFAALAPDATLNVLVLDLLNVPQAAQPLVLRQLRQFAEGGNPGGNLAIYALTDHLILLQSFAADPTVLKEAVEHRLIPRGAVANANPLVGDHDVRLMLTAANLQYLADGMRSVDRQFRAQFTLDAIHTLARSLDGLPGRKNLLWFSASFPLNLTPAKPPDGNELQQTAALLDGAQIAIDPIDARPALTPASGTLKFDETASAEHAAIDALATDTGGTALYGQPSLAAAVKQALSHSADAYYTLSFTPTPSQTPPKGSVLVALSGANAAALRLRYPALLFTAPPPAPDLPPPAPPASTKTTTPTPPATDPPAQTRPLSAFGNAALMRAAPAPQEILFKVRVLPASTATQPTVAPGNTLNPFYAVPGPWQPYDLDFATLASYFATPADATGTHHGRFQAVVYVYDTDGRLLNSAGKSLTADLTAAAYENAAHAAIHLRMIVSVPVRQESYLRLVLHDLTSDRFGVVEIPASAVSRLPPPTDGPPTSIPATAPH